MKFEVLMKKIIYVMFIWLIVEVCIVFTANNFTIIANAPSCNIADATTAPSVEFYIPVYTNPTQAETIPTEETEIETIELETMPQVFEPLFTEAEVEMIAKTIWGEAGGIRSKMEQAAVAWCILNHVDASGKPISKIVNRDRFHGYHPNMSCPESFYELARDVLARWSMEKLGEEDVGRVLPKEYLYFHGTGTHNMYRVNYSGDRNYWDWSLPNPYEN